MIAAEARRGFIQSLADMVRGDSDAVVDLLELIFTMPPAEQDVDVPAADLGAIGTAEPAALPAPVPAAEVSRESHHPAERPLPSPANGGAAATEPPDASSRVPVPEKQAAAPPAAREGTLSLMAAVRDVLRDNPGREYSLAQLYEAAVAGGGRPSLTKSPAAAASVAVNFMKDQHPEIRTAGRGVWVWRPTPLLEAPASARPDLHVVEVPPSASVQELAPRLYYNLWAKDEYEPVGPRGRGQSFADFTSWLAKKGTWPAPELADWLRDHGYESGSAAPELVLAGTGIA